MCPRQAAVAEPGVACPAGIRAERERGWLTAIALVALAVLAAAALLAFLGTAPARAHDGRHDFESLIAGISPLTLATGIEVRVLDYDGQLELVNASGKTVIVEGYEGEPYAKVESGGPVYLNVRSPSLAPSNDRWGQTAPSGNEDAAAAPRWVQVASDGRLAWFDRRSHYRGAGTPPAVIDISERQKLWDYRIPLTVGAEAATIEGALFWAGRRPFPVAMFSAMLIATAGCAFFGAWAMKRIHAPDRQSAI